MKSPRGYKRQYDSDHDELLASVLATNKATVAALDKLTATLSKIDAAHTAAAEGLDRALKAQTEALLAIIKE
jgi:hypothetical protein